MVYMAKRKRAKHNKQPKKSPIMVTESSSVPKAAESDAHANYVTFEEAQKDQSVSLPRLHPRVTRDFRFRVKTDVSAVCDVECGGFRVTTKVTVTNTCARRVRCDDMTWYLRYGQNTAAKASQWVGLNGGTSHSFDVVLQAPVKSFPFEVTHSLGSCAFN